LPLVQSLDDGVIMRSRVLLLGITLFVIGGGFTLLGTITGTTETIITHEEALNNSYDYDYLGSHEYKTNVNLVPGSYELHYSFSSNETVTEFYVNVLDPDGSDIESVYGPPTVYQNQNAQFSFETQKAGLYTFILGGKWTSVQVNLDKLTQSTKIVYPYEVLLYLGLVFLMGGGISGLCGAAMKKKRTCRWYD
jgi:hypothetical protein